MFKTEQSSKKAFFNRLHREGRQFLMGESYDYFNPGDEDAIKHDDEPEKEPDITWNIDDDNQSSSTDGGGQDESNLETENQQENTSETLADTTEPEMKLGFWGKIKNYIMG